jgi:hypothetical protein
MSGFNFTPNTGPVTSDSGGNKNLWFPVIFVGIKTSQLNLTGTLGKLTPTPLAGRKVVMICNAHASDTIYVGDGTVTVANGVPLSPGDKLIVSIADNIDLYGISSGTSTDCRLMEGL